MSKTKQVEVNDQLISHLAKLARLAPTEQEATKLKGDLKNILKMVAKLEELDLKTVQPLRYVTGQQNDLRPDKIGDHIDRRAALDNAPDADHEGGFFRVPRVIEE